MESLRELKEVGAEMGLAGKDLLDFVREQQTKERAERAKIREEDIRLKELEVERIAAENHRMEVQIHDKDADHRIHIRKMELETDLKLESMKLDAAALQPPQKQEVKQEVRRTKLQTSRAPLPKFNGKKIDYYPFKWDFEFLYRDYDSPDDKMEALYILKECCAEQPKKWIVSELDYDQAWDTLDERYGDPVEVSDEIVAQIRSYPDLKPHDPRISDFYLFLKNGQKILSKLKKGQDLDNSTLISIIEKKLHVEDRLRWAELIRSERKETNLENFIVFLSDLIWVCERAHTTSTSAGGQQGGQQGGHQGGRFRSHGLGEKKRCWFCETEHLVTDCEEFKKLSPDDRLFKARDARSVCFRCMKQHRLPCNTGRVCGTEIGEGNKCKLPHHPLLHGADFKKVRVQSVCAKFSELSAKKLLPILTIVAKNPERGFLSAKTNVLLDIGSELTLITHALAKNLKLHGRKTHVIICPVGENEYEFDTYEYDVVVQGIGSNFSPYTIKAVGLPKLSQNVEKLDLQHSSEKTGLKSDIKRKSGPVDMIIGIDNMDFHFGELQMVDDNLGIRLSVLGPVLVGTMDKMDSNSPTHKIERSEQVAKITVMEPPDLTAFWSTEALGVMINNCCKNRKRGEKFSTVQEKDQVDRLKSSAKLVENRWMFDLPWHRDPAELENNQKQAFAQLTRNERKLLNDSDPNRIEQYKDQMRELETLEYSRKLSQKEIDEYKGPVFYMTHHAVYNPEKPLRPCRVVWNSALSYKGGSLNTFLCKCGDQLLLMAGVQLRWREFEQVYFGDVFRMYHQVLTSPPVDHHTHRYLYREFDQTKPPEHYVKQVLTFGDVSSPAVANVAMEMTAELFVNQPEMKDAAEVILHNRYMDDVANSVAASVDLKEHLEKVDKILDAGHFKIKEWKTNVESTDSEPVKILGTLWFAVEDEISISIRPPKALQLELETIVDRDFPLTKRIALSAMSSAFDNFGIGAPVIIKGKILMQKTWSLGIGWDDVLPVELRKSWLNWLKDLIALKDIRFKRCLTPPGAVGKPALVSFCDASRDATGAACYLRWTLENGNFSTTFIMAKARVTPLKEISLPKLELQAAMIASRLVNTIVEETRLEFDNIYHFTDSMITLAWITGESKTFMPFVATRVGEIQDKTSKENWMHIPGTENVADVLTRGLKPSELNGRFENGPEFLRAPVEGWPISREIESTTLEGRVQVHNISVSRKKLDSFWGRIGSKLKLVRVMASVLRLRENLLVKARIKSLKTRANTQKLNYGPYTTEELQGAEMALVKLAQVDLPDTYAEDYITLSPFADENGVIRVGGRRGKANVSYDQRHPILLPHGSWLSKLVVEDSHNHGHPGVNTTTAKVRKRFWILKLPGMVKTIVFNCVICRELRRQTNEQLMATLPVERLNPTPPFYHASCDLYGPYNVKLTRNTKTKYWGVLFTCLTTRAVYADVAQGYSGPDFIQTFRRFITIRAMPRTMLSDRGSQLIYAAKEIETWCSNRGIEWKFVTATAAHHNGVTESLVKSIKNAMKFAIKDTSLRPTELQTVMFEAANLVNERPLGVPPKDPDDGPYLCPNDALLGRSSSIIPHGPFAENPSIRDRVAFCQEIVNSFWERWYRDVFPTLTPTPKWHTEKRNLKIGDIVLVKKQSAFRGEWMRARVVKTYPGDDNKVRSVRVRTGPEQEYDRPITKLVCILPVEEQNQS